MRCDIVADPIGELIVAVGEAIAKDDEFSNWKNEKNPKLKKFLSYLIPMSILTGIYIWVAYF